MLELGAKRMQSMDLNTLTTLNGICSLEDMKLSRELIGSMYPEKFTFENLKHQTAQVTKLRQSCIGFTAS